MRSPTPGGGAASTNAPDFRQAFLNHVHQLLQIGYSRLDAAALADAHEPDISGRIADAIESFLDEPPVEGWEIFYFVGNESPEPDAARDGNRRLKTDIGIKSSHTSPRQRFVFEAKRLRDRASLRAYLGDEGLGAFVNGDYARDSLDAGMLGYVQTDTPDEWAQRIAERIGVSSARLRVAEARPWQRRGFAHGPDHTYLCGHARIADAGPIDVYHTLLRFH